MKKEDVSVILDAAKTDLYQACCKFFYKYPECLTTVERRKLYDLAKRKEIDKILNDCPEMSENEADSILRMRCCLSSKIRSDEIDAYRDFIFSAAEKISELK